MGQYEDSPLASVASRLGEAFRDLGFGEDGIAGALGPAAYAALYRGEPGAVSRALSFITPESSHWPVQVLTRLFVMGEEVQCGDVEKLLGGDLVAELVSEDLLVIRGGHATAAVEIRPRTIDGEVNYVFADFDASMKNHVPGKDHVLGVGAASLSLLQAVPRTPVSSVLDLGCGSGIQTLGQLPYADTVTATDIHRRALRLAGATLAASGRSNYEVLEGSWFEPVSGRSFERIVANPPFVVGPAAVGHVYRDSGLGLDGATEATVRGAAKHLAPGGQAFLLGAWAHVAGETWQQRIARWLPHTGVAAWVLQRDVADPEMYVSTWLRDESIDPRSDLGKQRTRDWLDFFAEHDVTGIGFGWIGLEAIGQQPTEVVAEELAQPFTDPLGPEFAEYFKRAGWLRQRTSADILSSQLCVRPTVAVDAVSVTDTDTGLGFAPSVTRISRLDGPLFNHEIDNHLQAIVAGLHPQGLNLEDVIELYTAAQGLDAAAITADCVAAIVDLIRHGIVLPADLVEIV
ncbi:transferase [Corynebacterium renale]|uniref:DUF7782 domain-containing protein n=1 Tax=Corynebacterium renale TaxID=1724 RepID=UPI000DA3748D|nr:class I SAM-dependent methyltransferase [Corynebacterium renale]SQG64830.1 transferase [Corynebacterium renale]STC96388.1 transferase [Corynebacterium renale]